MTKRVKMVRGSNNVFRDLGFPEEQARNLLLRSQIMICIEQFVERSALTQARAAALLGLTQPRLNALLKGKMDQFSLDALVNTATRAGLHVELHVTSTKRAGGHSRRVPKGPHRSPLGRLSQCIHQLPSRMKDSRLGQARRNAEHPARFRRGKTVYSTESICLLQFRGSLRTCRSTSAWISFAA